MTRLVAFLALSLTMAMARGDPATLLAERIPLGLWQFSAQRVGLFKPLSWTYREEDVSQTCIRSDPRQHLLDWITRKGCNVASEELSADGYVMTGSCRLKWLPGRPIAVEVRFAWRGTGRFDMDITSRDHSLMTYAEHTHATFLGPCADTKTEVSNPGR